MNDTALGLVQEAAAIIRKIVIPYIPREHFKRLHASTKRWKFVVAHRRAGKSVAEINEMIKAALLNKRTFPRPRYAYVGPSFAQTKDLIWGYLKHYAGAVPGTTFSESDLTCTLPNGATISLYGGAAAYERMRGLYFDGIVLDEFPLLNPSVLSTVVRPCLADYRGWAIISGTSNGDDHFHALLKKHRGDPGWDFFIIPVTETDALHPDEVEEMTADMSAEEYAREMLCRFDAPIEGAYYAELMNRAEANKRIVSVPHDTSQPVFTWWDLGMSDTTPIWYIQAAGRELHVINFTEFSGKGLEFYAKLLKGQHEQHPEMAEYNYSAHVLPHDIMARELGTGKSRFEVLSSLVPESQPLLVAPSLSVEDGIQAVRSVIPMCYWDAEKAEDGISGLRNYARSKSGKPVHNWASHPADAFRVGSVSLHQTLGLMGSGNVVSLRGGRLRRRIRGMV